MYTKASVERSLKSSNAEIVALAQGVQAFAKQLAVYAQLKRDAVASHAFLGNNARSLLAFYLDVDVLELEPGTEQARAHLNSI